MRVNDPTKLNERAYTLRLNIIEIIVIKCRACIPGLLKGVDSDVFLFSGCSFEQGYKTLHVASSLEST